MQGPDFQAGAVQGRGGDHITVERPANQMCELAQVGGKAFGDTSQFHTDGSPHRVEGALLTGVFAGEVHAQRSDLKQQRPDYQPRLHACAEAVTAGTLDTKTSFGEE